MKILHLETSSKNCSVAVSDGYELKCLCEEFSTDYKHSEKLHTFVEWALEGADLSLQQLDAVCIGSGPGSYTGLRIAASAAKGFCFGLGIPLLAVESPETLVPPFLGKDFSHIIPLIDARRQEVYSTVFCGRSGEKRSQTKAQILDENSFAELHGQSVIFVGDGAAKASEILNFPAAVYDPSVYPSAKYLVNGAVRRFEQQKFEDVAYFEPFYLKEFYTTAKKKSES